MEIRIYVEGGGDGKDTRAKVRQGFSQFLKDVVALAREKRIGWNIIASGSRNSTFDDFQTALRTHPEAFNVLLVDAEGPVNTDPRQHLQNRDGWNLSALNDEQCHLNGADIRSLVGCRYRCSEKILWKAIQSESNP